MWDIVICESDASFADLMKEKIIRLKYMQTAFGKPAPKSR